MIEKTYLNELIAKESIRDVIYKYCRAMDRIDREMGYSVFSPKCQVDYGIWFKGTAYGFVDWVSDFHSSKILATSHQVSNIMIQVNGDKAGSETYVHVVLRSVSEDGRLQEQMGLGRYIDEWAIINGEWKITERKYVMDISDIRDITTDAGQTGGGSRDKTDPSYTVLR